MKKDRFLFAQDRFLIAILLGILGVMILAVVVFVTRPDTQGFGAEDTPAGVARNYILALQKGDYNKAYLYLDTTGKNIDLNKFQNELLPSQPEIKRISVQLGETEQTGDKALVALTLLHPGNGPFEDGWRENGSAVLVQDSSGNWKIISLPYIFWPANLFLDKTTTP